MFATRRIFFNVWTTSHQHLTCVLSFPTTGFASKTQRPLPPQLSPSTNDTKHRTRRMLSDVATQSEDAGTPLISPSTTEQTDVASSLLSAVAQHPARSHQKLKKFFGE